MLITAQKNCEEQRSRQDKNSFLHTWKTNTLWCSWASIYPSSLQKVCHGPTSSPQKKSLSLGSTRGACLQEDSAQDQTPVTWCSMPFQMYKVNFCSMWTHDAVLNMKCVDISCDIQAFVIPVLGLMWHKLISICQIANGGDTHSHHWKDKRLCKLGLVCYCLN